jgi:hypothetical protein
MIRWLEDDRLAPEVMDNMARFKATSFAKDLDEDRASWRFMSWPRTDHTPLRFLLQSDDHRNATFTIDGDGYEYGKLEG